MTVAALAREAEAQALAAERPARAAVRGEEPWCPEHASRVVAVVEHDHVVALGDHGEVAVGDGGVEHPLGEDPVEPVAQPRPALGLDEFLVARAVLGAAGLEPPLAHERRALVEEGCVVGERDALDDPGAPERRHGDRVVGDDVRPGRHVLGLGELEGGARIDALLQRREADLGRGGAPRDGHERIHEREPLERVARVPHLAVEQRGEVVLDEGAGERGAAEQHGPLRAEPALVQLEQVLLHDDRGLHEQPAHADDVGVVLLGRADELARSAA